MNSLSNDVIFINNINTYLSLRHVGICGSIEFRAIFRRLALLELVCPKTNTNKQIAVLYLYRS